MTKLGIGRYRNFTIHLHSTPPAALELLSDGEDDGKEAGRAGTNATSGTSAQSTKTSRAGLEPEAKRQSAVIDLLDDSDDEAVPIDAPSSKRRRT